MASEDFLAVLMEVENGSRIGFDQATGRWFPHDSPEGGAPTIGYGHKLDDVSPQRLERIMREGVTDEQVNAWLLGDVVQAESIAGRDFNRHRNELNDPRSFRELPEREREAYTEIAFNMGRLERDGRWGWPLLHHAFATGNQADIRENIRRSFVRASTGQREWLDARTNRLADYYLHGNTGRESADPAAPLVADQAPQFVRDARNRLNIMIRRSAEDFDGEQTASGL